MTDVSQGRGWWQASDGKWYPPHLHRYYQAASPGEPTWWQASDGNWYPPESYTQPVEKQTSEPQPNRGWASAGIPVVDDSPSVSGQRPSAVWNGARKPAVVPEDTGTPRSGSSRALMVGVGLGDLPPGARLETDRRPMSPLPVLALVLAVLVWPVGLVTAYVVRRRLRRTGEGGWGLTAAALWIGAFLALVTVVGVPVLLLKSAAGNDTETHLQAAAVTYMNTQLSSEHQSATATSALCLQQTGTHWSCQVSLSNGQKQTLQVTVNNVGQQFQIAAGTTTQQLTQNAVDRVAQTNLATALTAANTLYSQTETYGTTAHLIGILSNQEPDLTYTSQGSTGQEDISVDVSSSSELYLAALGLQTGHCWLVRDQAAGGGTTYAVVPNSTPGSCSATLGPSEADWSSTFPS